MSKPVITYGMDCFGTYFTHVQTCDDVRVTCYRMDCFGTYFTHAQTCDDVRVQSATEWTASVHTSHMSKPVMTFVFKVLRSGLLRYILQTLMTKFRRCALPKSLHVKDGPGGGLTDKLMSYVYAFVWRSNLGNKANMPWS